MRPDEEANQEEIRRDRATRGAIKKGVGAAASFGAGLAGGPIAARIAPFLSEFIPEDLAIKGINKVSPQMGNILQKGMSMGLHIEEGLQFIKNKIMPSQSAEQAKTPSPLDEAEQIAPGLIGYVKEIIEKDQQKPETAINLVLAPRNLERFKDEIKRLEGASGMAFTDYLMSLLTGKKPQEQQALQPPQAAQQAPPPATQGGGQQALMEALQKLQQIRGK